MEKQRSTKEYIIAVLNEQERGRPPRQARNIRNGVLAA
jgi:hypothetical protein